MAEAPKLDIALCDEIEAVIAPHLNNRVGPPFSKDALVVMASICLLRGREEVIAKWRIPSWIQKNFRYYELQTRKRPIRDINGILDRYEVPHCGSNLHMGAVDSLYAHYSLPLREVRAFLQDILYGPPAGAFRFLDLPAEIRVRVYEMLFSFPQITVGMSKHYSEASTLCVTEREHQIGLDRQSRGAYVDTRPLQRILATLSVNKQIHEEANPYFCQINHFKAKDAARLAAWVQSVHPSRLAHVRHISFRYGPISTSAQSKLKAAPVLLSKVNRLRTLEIETDDRAWFSIITFSSKTNSFECKYSDLSSLPHRGAGEIGEDRGEGHDSRELP